MDLPGDSKPKERDRCRRASRGGMLSVGADQPLVEVDSTRRKERREAARSAGKLKRRCGSAAEREATLPNGPWCGWRFLMVRDGGGEGRGDALEIGRVVDKQRNEEARGTRNKQLCDCRSRCAGEFTLLGRVSPLVRTFGGWRGEVMHVQPNPVRVLPPAAAAGGNRFFVLC